MKSGVAVVVEAGAGERALLPDELYTAAGQAYSGPNLAHHCRIVS